MTFLPIVTRELRVASRRNATYRVRAYVALAGMLIVGGMLLINRVLPSGVLTGAAMFTTLAWLVFLYCLVQGVPRTSDCLSEEKRDGTLGLLFLTDLKGFDVVLGKLFATSLNAFYGVLAMLPVMGLAMLFGGVTGGEFWRTALALASTLFFSLAVGLGVSALSRDSRAAMGLTLILLVFFTAGPPLVYWIQSTLSKAAWAEYVLSVSPGVANFLAFDRSYATHAGQFWRSQLFIHLLGWGFLGLASFCVPRTWQDKPAGARAERWLHRRRNWSYGNAATSARWQARMLDINPVLWLVSRNRWQRTCLWGFLGLLVVIWIWGCIELPGNAFLGWFTAVMEFVYFVVLYIWITSQAVLCFAEARRNGALELLLSTPLTVADILRGQWLAIRRLFLWPFILALAFSAMTGYTGMKGTSDAPIQVSGPAGATSTTVTSFALYAGPHISQFVTESLGVAVLATDLLALVWFGMWMGLTAKNPNQATYKTLIFVLVLPWVGMIFVAPFLSLGTFFWKFPFWLNMAATTGLLVFKNLAFIFWSRQKFKTEFRARAAQMSGWTWALTVHPTATPQPPPRLVNQ